MNAVHTSADGFRHVTDAREYLLRPLLQVVAAAQDTDPNDEPMLYLGGQRGLHVVTPCPHDRMCPPRVS